VSHDDEGLIGGQPVDPYLLNLGGEVYAWRPDLRRWEFTEQHDYNAARKLQQIEAVNPAAMPKPEYPWKDNEGRPLYRNPDIPRIISIPRPPEIPRINGLAQAARVFSFLGILLTPCALIGAICGHIALGQIRDGDLRSRSVALTAITVGWIIVGLTILIVIFIASHG
jgi:hypothetical protein